MSAPVYVATVMRRGAELAANRRKPPLGRPEPVPPGPGSVPARRGCTYCGRKPRRASVTCHAHSDLPAIDPFFSPDIPQAAGPADRPRP